MKSQINMFETIAVIIIFIFLLGIGFVIYASVHQSNLEKAISKDRAMRAQKVAERAFYLPELDCSFRGIRAPGACLEKLKVDALAQVNNNPSAMVSYYPLFGYARIKIYQIFPRESTGYSRVIYDNTPPGEQIVSRTPVLLLNPVRGPSAYAFGIMEVTSTYAS